MGRSLAWGGWHDAQLASLVAAGDTWDAIAEALGCSPTHAALKARQAGLAKPAFHKGPRRDPAFDAALTAILTAPGPRPSWPRIAAMLGRSPTNCQKRAQALGLYVPEAQKDPGPDGAGTGGGIPPLNAAAQPIPGREAGDDGDEGDRCSSSLNLPGVSAPGAFSGMMTEWPGPEAPIRDWCRPVAVTLQPMAYRGNPRGEQGQLAAKLAKRGARA